MVGGGRMMTTCDSIDLPLASKHASARRQSGDSIVGPRGESHLATESTQAHFAIRHKAFPQKSRFHKEPFMLEELF
jgi:hypothetical protein